MTAITRKRLEVVRKRNEQAIKDVDRRSREIKDAVVRSRAVTEAALSSLRRAGYAKK